VRRWPLLICRSPLSNSSGLILPEPPLRDAALQRIVEEARREAKERRCSFLLFDYLGIDEVHGLAWPEGFRALEVADAGTRLRIAWADFDEYLAGLSQKTRKHYRQHQREAQATGIQITRHEAVGDIGPALALMRNVERRHRASPNPWWRRMLEEASMVDAVWLAAVGSERLLGCELILEDNGTQMVTALGLAEGTSHVYFLLGYEDIQYAIEKGNQYLRWGSGTYDVKRHLGFELESNNHIVLAGTGIVSPLVTLIARLWE
jgi:predicted N-acyltransferase